MKYVAELRFCGLGAVERRLRIDEPRQTLYHPIATIGEPKRLQVKYAAEVKQFKFTSTGIYPSKWYAGEVTEMVVMYELEDIIGKEVQP